MNEAHPKKAISGATSTQLHESKRDKKKAAASYSGICNKFYETKENGNIWYTGRERVEIRKRKEQKAVQDKEQ